MKKKYELFNKDSLLIVIKEITLLSNYNIKDIISKNQNYLINNENEKYNNISDIFDDILKDTNV